jgi:hypothetical protein
METLAVVEVLGRRGEVLYRERIHRFPAVVGRAFDADVIVDDEFVAAHHLRIDEAEAGNFLLTGLDVDNAFSVIGCSGDNSQGSAVTLVPGSTIRFGHSQIRLWRPDSRVPAKAGAFSASERNGLRAAFMVMLAVLVSAAEAWSIATGVGRDGVVGFWIFVILLIILGWSGVWWVCGRQSKDGTSFLAHVDIAATSVLFAFVGCYILESLVFAFGLYDRLPVSPTAFMLWAALSYAVWRHLRLISRMKSWALGAIACICVSLLTAANIYIDAEEKRAKIGELSLPSMMRPPWMRVVEGVSPEAFLDKVLPVEEQGKTARQ